MLYNIFILKVLNFKKVNDKVRIEMNLKNVDNKK